MIRFPAGRKTEANRSEIEPFFTVRSHGLQWRALRVALAKGEGVILLTGPEGVGKSQLLLRLRGLLPESWDMALVSNAGQAQASFTQAICAAIGVDVAGPEEWSMTVDEVLDAVASRVEFGRNVLLVVDDAQDITQENLNIINSLLLFSASHGSALQLLFSGRPELLHFLEHPAFQLIRNATIASLALTPLTRLEMREYVRYQTRRMLGLVPRVTWPAWMELYAASHGIPRTIDRLLHEILFLHPNMPSRFLTGYAVRQGRMAMDAEYHPVPGRRVAPWLAGLVPLSLVLLLTLPAPLLPSLTLPSIATISALSGWQWPAWPWQKTAQPDPAASTTPAAVFSTAPPPHSGTVTPSQPAATASAKAAEVPPAVQGGHPSPGVVFWEGTVQKEEAEGVTTMVGGSSLPVPEARPMKRNRAAGVAKTAP
ncbi:MAG: AAA family ATPase [Magnetococcales bacterium]|nr:AAA family ATPase [Magnetococcales bacterium]